MRRKEAQNQWTPTSVKLEVKGQKIPWTRKAWLKGLKKIVVETCFIKYTFAFLGPTSPNVRYMLMLKCRVFFLPEFLKDKCRSVPSHNLTPVQLYLIGHFNKKGRVYASISV